MSLTLVTGSTGFLGKHLLAQLLEADDSARFRLLLRRPESAPKDPRVEVFQGDVTDRESVLKAIRRHVPEMSKKSEVVAEMEPKIKARSKNKAGSGAAA